MVEIVAKCVNIAPWDTSALKNFDLRNEPSLLLLSVLLLSFGSSVAI